MLLKRAGSIGLHLLQVNLAGSTVAPLESGHAATMRENAANTMYSTIFDFISAPNSASRISVSPLLATTTILRGVRVLRARRSHACVSRKIYAAIIQILLLYHRALLSMVIPRR